MDDDYVSGSLATLIIDLLTSQEWQPDLLPEHVIYQEYIRSDAWKERAKIARKQANYRCQLGGEPGDDHTLQVHHNNYERLGDERDTDLIVLCPKHHKQFHGITPC